MNSTQYTRYYSESGFWSKVFNYGKAAGKGIIEKVLLLYYAGQKPETPVWAKSTIHAALGYFIWPFDAIRDGGLNDTQSLAGRPESSFFLSRPGPT